MTIKSIFITFDSRMPLNICNRFLFAVLKISKGLVFLSGKKNTIPVTISMYNIQ